MMIVILALLVLCMVVYIIARSNGYDNPIDAMSGSRDMMLKFLATTYLTNNDFVEDPKVKELTEKLNISYTEIINYAESHKDELLKNSKTDK